VARHRQYIGRLMRDIDLEAVRGALAGLRTAREPARRYNGPMQPLVGIIMGSASDWETMRHAAETLDALGVPHEVRIVSAHRTPDLLFEYAGSAQSRGLEVIIAGAGGAAHLPGMAAAKTPLPVLGVPVQSRTLSGLDSLLSIVQMPAGVPVATFAIGAAGAVNAALCAGAILAGRHPAIASAVREHRERQTASVLEQPDPRVASRTDPRGSSQA
jgi:5-(carboxyamino)imidazole ribonucleotide mutase